MEMEPSEIYLTVVLGACIGWFVGNQMSQFVKWLRLKSATVASRRPPFDR
jgi:hypothetical protein